MSDDFFGEENNNIDTGIDTGVDTTPVDTSSVDTLTESDVTKFTEPVYDEPVPVMGELEETAPDAGQQSTASGWENQSSSADSYSSSYSNSSYNNSSYGNSGFQNANYTQPVSDGYGIASMVLGIVSLIFFCTCCNILTGILAVVFGIIHLTKQGTHKGYGIAGIVTAAISILLFIGGWGIILGNASLYDSIQNDFGNVMPYIEDDGSLSDDWMDKFLKEYNSGLEEDGTY